MSRTEITHDKKWVKFQGPFALVLVLKPGTGRKIEPICYSCYIMMITTVLVMMVVVVVIVV